MYRDINKLKELDKPLNVEVSTEVMDKIHKEIEIERLFKEVEKPSCYIM